MPQPILADLSGRTCLVTGANSGIGKETARQLAGLGAHVVLACRSSERGQAARDEIVHDTGNEKVELAVVDLAVQQSIRDFGQDFRHRYTALHVLVNNAGTWSNRREESAEGIEVTWATNALAYFLLTELLLDLIERSAPARIVNVASELAGDLDLGDVEFRRRQYGGVAAYSQSKQANRMWTWALARRLQGTGVTANAMHPGGVNTPLFRKGGGFKGLLGSVYGKVLGKSPSEGADTIVWLAASPDVESESGKFWIDRAEARCRFRGTEAEEALWSLCASMTHGVSPSQRDSFEER
jgi:NAD(P)-dependent dehydrogenase (short-subunit alcohol dehydrogenase family)